MRHFIVHELAEEEILDAAYYYHSLFDELAIDFAADLETAFQSIRKHSETWRIVSHGCRVISLDKFPYNVIYTMNDERILVLAIMHNRMFPDHWVSRLT